MVIFKFQFSFWSNAHFSRHWTAFSINSSRILLIRETFSFLNLNSQTLCSLTHVPRLKLRINWHTWTLTLCWNSCAWCFAHGFSITTLATFIMAPYPVSRSPIILCINCQRISKNLLNIIIIFCPLVFTVLLSFLNQRS